MDYRKHWCRCVQLPHATIIFFLQRSSDCKHDYWIHISEIQARHSIFKYAEERLHQQQLYPQCGSIAATIMGRTFQACKCTISLGLPASQYSARTAPLRFTRSGQGAYSRRCKLNGTNSGKWKAFIVDRNQTLIYASMDTKFLEHRSLCPLNKDCKSSQDEALLLKLDAFVCWNSGWRT